MFESFTMQLMLDCGGCGQPMPVNGISEHVSCRACGHAVHLDAGFWTNAFEPEYFAEALGFDEGTGRQVTQFGGHSAKIFYGRRRPRCQSCKGPDLEPAVLSSDVAAGSCFCPGCGGRILLRPADELCRAINPAARFMVGETLASDEMAALQAKREPVLFSCMGCGGGLKVDGSARSVTCTYCNASNYLPDGLWQQLNPVPTMQAFFMVCEYDERSLSMARLQSEDSAKEEAGKGGLPHEVYMALARHEEWEVRAALAKNPAAPPDVLVLLSHDSDSDVSEALAGNPNLPVEALSELARSSDYQKRMVAAGHPHAPAQLLATLAADTDNDVLEALSRNPNIGPELAERLASSSNWQVRQYVAKNPSMPIATLHRLTRDSDSDVQTAARQRLDELKAQGHDVTPPKRGLFAKLFGG